MLFEELLSEEREAGREEGRVAMLESIFDLLEGKGMKCKELCDMLEAEKDLNKLKKYVKTAAKAISVEQFQKEISEF